KHPTLGKIGIIHAEIPAGMAWNDFTQRLIAGDEDTRNHVLWSRARIAGAMESRETEKVPEIDLIFCGHTILQEPRLFGNTYYIDTGAFLEDHGRLTMVEINEELTPFQEPSRTATIPL